MLQKYLIFPNLPIIAPTAYSRHVFLQARYDSYFGRITYYHLSDNIVGRCFVVRNAAPLEPKNGEYVNSNWRIEAIAKFTWISNDLLLPCIKGRSDASAATGSYEWDHDIKELEIIWVPVQANKTIKSWHQLISIDWCLRITPQLLNE